MTTYTNKPANETRRVGSRDVSHAIQKMTKHLNAKKNRINYFKKLGEHNIFKEIGSGAANFVKKLYNIFVLLRIYEQLMRPTNQIIFPNLIKMMFNKSRGMEPDEI